MNLCLQLRLLSVYALIFLLFMLSSCAGNNLWTDSTSSSVQQDIVVDDNVKIMFTQALTYLQQQEYDEAITLLEALITKERRLSAPFVNLGIAYSRTGETKKAEQSFIAALRLDVGHAVANNELGLLYRKSGRLGAARVAYENAVAQHPDYLPARKNLGILCEIYLHDLACALEQYQAYMEHKPNDETISRWALELKQRIQSR